MYRETSKRMVFYKAKIAILRFRNIFCFNGSFVEDEVTISNQNSCHGFIGKVITTLVSHSAFMITKSIKNYET